MGLVGWVNLFDIPHTKVHIHGNTKSFHLPVHLGNFDEQPHKIQAPGRCRIISIPNWKKETVKALKTLK